MVKLWSLETNHCLIGAAGLEVLVLSPRNPEDNFLVLLSNVLQRHPEQADLSLLMEYALQETDEQVGIIARFADCLEARCFAVSVVHQLRDSTDQQKQVFKFGHELFTPSYKTPPENEYVYAIFLVQLGATSSFIPTMLQ